MIPEPLLLVLEKLPMCCTARKCARSQESMSHSRRGGGMLGEKATREPQCVLCRAEFQTDSTNRLLMF